MYSEVELLKERAVRLKDSLNKQMEKLNREKETHEMLKSSAVKQKEEHLKAVDDEFDKIIKKLNERRVSLKEEYEKCVNDELRIADNVYSKRASFAEKFSVLQADTVKLLTTFGMLVLYFTKQAKTDIWQRVQKLSKALPSSKTSKKQRKCLMSIQKVLQLQSHYPRSSSL